jgi:hypothetical protein
VRLFGRTILSRAPGAIIRPARNYVSRWPTCYICKKSVHAYGIETESDSFVEVWMECKGVELDPRSGKVVENVPRRHELRRTSIRIDKGPTWTHQRFTQIMGDTIVFAPAGEGERDFVAELNNPLSVRPH